MLGKFVNEVRIPQIIVIGTWDSKGEVLEEIANLVIASGATCIRINLGGLKCSKAYRIDYDDSIFAKAAGRNIEEIRSQNRANAVAIIKKGISAAVGENAFNLKTDGIIGVGGTNGTELVTTFLREFPDIPSICISTVAQHENHHFTRHFSNIYLINSLTDIGSDLNSALEDIIVEAVGALMGRIMARHYLKKNRPIKLKIAVSQFGTTTRCVETCSARLKEQGYEIYPFHVVGSGGKNMEALITEGKFQGVLEITPTELADLYGGGVYSAGPLRLKAAIKKKIAQVFVPGCLDMINLRTSEVDINDPRFKGRTLYKATDEVTVMRPTFQELRRIAQHVVDNFHQAQSVIKVLLPLKGISVFDHPANKEFPWYDPCADAFLFAELKRLIKLHCDHIEVIEVDCHINDPQFAELAVSWLLKAMAENQNYASKVVGKFFNSSIQEPQNPNTDQHRLERAHSFS